MSGQLAEIVKWAPPSAVGRQPAAALTPIDAAAAALTFVHSSPD